MRNLLIVFFVICFLMMVVFFPFKTRLMGHLNLIDLKCYYSLKAWMIKLLSGKIIFENGEFEFAIDSVSEILQQVHPQAYEEMVRFKEANNE